jgi:hypothetical protein
MKSMMICCLIQLLISFDAQSWGFWAHRKINRLAVFCLPPEMMVLFKKQLQYIEENAVNPDRRRYTAEAEAPRHYIDVDVYGDSAVYYMPRYWKEAVDCYTEDTLKAYGIVPWHVYMMKYRLTEAFRIKDVENILRLSAEIGHYIADANVPLHTTVNYNGQLTGQKGIHGLWESRLPELFAADYDFFVGKATYLRNPRETIWQAVIQAHEAKDSVLLFEQQLSARFSEDKKYAVEEKGRSLVQQYSAEYARAYHQMLNGQVERQMRNSIKMVADFWYTCWVDAGMPDLQNIPVMSEKKKPKEEKYFESEDCVR